MLEVLARVRTHTSHHYHAIGDFIGMRLETDHVVASANDKPRLAAGLA